MLTNSLALLSDAGHMLSDAISLAVALRPKWVKQRIQHALSATEGLKYLPLFLMV